MVSAISFIRREYRKTLWNRGRENERAILRQMAKEISDLGGYPAAEKRGAAGVTEPLPVVAALSIWRLSQQT